MNAKMKLIHNEQADQNPIYAVMHAQANNNKYRSIHSLVTKSKANALRQLVERAYTRSRVFVNYREKFIAVKVMNVDPRDSFNIGEMAQLEQYVNSNGIEEVRTGKRSVIYRVR